MCKIKFKAHIDQQINIHTEVKESVLPSKNFAVMENQENTNQTFHKISLS